MFRLAAAAILATISMSCMANGASLIEDFTGRWSGEAIETSPESISPALLDIEIRSEGDGFELSWNDLAQIGPNAADAKSLRARFVGSDRKNVFEYEPEAGSFLDRMFAPPATGNPLEGETLLWARIEADMLVVYSLTINDDGEFDLEQYSWTKAEDGLVLRYREQTEELGEEITIEGRLAPARE